MKTLLVKKTTAPSCIANCSQTSGCATATAIITSKLVYSKFLANQKCLMDFETLIPFRNNWR